MKYVFWQLGDTPLHKASQFGNLGVIQLLLHKGANIHEANNVRKTTHSVSLMLHSCVFCDLYSMHILVL